MTHNRADAPPSRLALGALLGAAFHMLAAYHLIFIATVAAPFAFDVIGTTLLELWKVSHRPNAILNLASDGIFLALYSVFLVGLNRAVLIGPDAVRRPFHFSFGRREWLTFAYAVALVGALSLILLLAISVFSLFLGRNFFAEGLGVIGGAVPASAAFNLVCMLVAVRFVFIFPAIACDAEFGWRRSWADTKGIAGVLAGIVFASLMSVTVLKFGEAQLERYYAALGPVGPGVVRVVFDICYYYLEAVGILAVAMAYRQRVGLPVEQRSR